MSLTSAMLVGRSGLTASQAGVQVSANNIANAATPGYSRQTMSLLPTRGQSLGAAGSVGRGVSIGGIARQVSDAVQARLWSSNAQFASASAQLDSLSGLEATLQELTGNDLSSELASFFGTWSGAANLEGSDTLVVQQGQRLAEFMHGIRSDVLNVREQIQSQLGGLAGRANELMNGIAQLNKSIVRTERGQSQANSLRDQRDMLVTSLSELVDTSVIEQADGQYDVFVAGTPVVLGARNLGINVRTDSDGSQLTLAVVLSTNEQPLPITGGMIGGLLSSRDIGIEETLGTLDDIAAQLIFAVNKLHSTGIPTPGLTSTRGMRTIPSENRDIAMNSPLNNTFASLPFAATNGGFTVRVLHKESGLAETVRIDVDLDGITSAGVAGFDDDTSVEDIRTRLDGVNNLSASFTADGRLQISADAGYEVAFADDTSGVLAVLGVNSYFQGTNAADINIRADLLEDPSRLGAASLIGDTVVANGTALAIAGLQDDNIEALSGSTLQEHWAQRVQRIAVDTEYAQDRFESTGIVREGLAAQRAAASGVSIDEESINLINYQKQYEASARVISVARELLDVLLASV
ncbi:MAG: flagellar hook-associated protein FlgK [Planctomycetota bacterium]|nr:flagellar hook-associated protein FlgK [Planctomycetota bacterium]